jgi:hypothetical protein
LKEPEPAKVAQVLCAPTRGWLFYFSESQRRNARRPRPLQSAAFGTHDRGAGGVHGHRSENTTNQPPKEMAAMPYPELTPQQRRAVLHPQRGTAERKHDVPSRSFTSLKLDWITGTAYDRRLNAIAFRAGVIIAQHVNEKTGRAFPSEQLIAERTGISRWTVIRAVKLLQETGCRWPIMSWRCIANAPGAPSRRQQRPVPAT